MRMHTHTYTHVRKWFNILMCIRQTGWQTNRQTQHHTTSLWACLKAWLAWSPLDPFTSAEGEDQKWAPVSTLAPSCQHLPTSVPQTHRAEPHHVCTHGQWLKSSPNPVRIHPSPACTALAPWLQTAACVTAVWLQCAAAHMTAVQPLLRRPICMPFSGIPVPPCCCTSPTSAVCSVLMKQPDPTSPFIPECGGGVEEGGLGACSRGWLGIPWGPCSFMAPAAVEGWTNRAWFILGMRKMAG